MNNAIEKFIDTLYDRCVARVVYRLRRVPSKGWDSDDSPMRTLWDHWKMEMQQDHSFVHDLIEGMVGREVRWLVEKLPQEEGALMTMATDEWIDLDDELDEPTFLPGAVAEEVMARVNRRACDEPHRREVQQMLDNQASDRFDRDNEWQR